MAKVIHFKDTPLTLVGRSLKNGMPAPDFRVVDQGLKEVSLAAFKGRVKIFTSFPSLDTPVCDLQVKEFLQDAQRYQEAGGLRPHREESGDRRRGPFVDIRHPNLKWNGRCLKTDAG